MFALVYLWSREFPTASVSIFGLFQVQARRRRETLRPGADLICPCRPHAAGAALWCVALVGVLPGAARVAAWAGCSGLREALVLISA